MRMFNFGFNTLTSKSPCMRDILFMFKYDLCFTRNINKIANEVYGINDIFENDRYAVQARIEFVQDRELGYHNNL